MAARFASLRRRYWRLLFVGIAFFAGLAPVTLAFGTRLDTGASMVAAPLMLGVLTCLLGCVVTWTSLMRFRCPRCGGRFILGSGSSWPIAACKQCNLDLGASRDPECEP